MVEQKIFCGNSIEEVAKEFSEIVYRNYVDYLEFWRWNAIGEEEINKWEKKMKEEPKLVRKNAYKKILKIMQCKKEYEEYYKSKWLIFTEEDIIDITKETNFYKDLLPNEDIAYTTQNSRKYRINRKKFTIARRC